MIAKSVAAGGLPGAHRDDAAQVGAGARDAAQPRPGVVGQLHLGDRRPLDRDIPLAECQRPLGARQHDLELRRVEQQGHHASSLPAPAPRLPGDLLTGRTTIARRRRRRSRCETGSVTLLEPARAVDVSAVADALARASARRAAGRRRRRGAARRCGRRVRAAARSSPAPCATPGSRHPVVPASSPTRARCSSRSRRCAAIAATTASSSTLPAQLLKLHKPRYMSPEQVLAGRAAGRGARLQRGAAHPRRPARGPLARSPRVARRARLRLDARLRRRDGPAHHRRDRPARAPEPRRHDARTSCGCCAPPRRRWG